MPIHDQGYRRYGGQRAARGQSWLVIARAGIRTFLSKRVFLGFLLAGWLLFLYESIKSYFAINVPQTANLPPVGQSLLRFARHAFSIASKRGASATR